LKGAILCILFILSQKVLVLDQRRAGEQRGDRMNRIYRIEAAKAQEVPRDGLE